MKKIDLDEIKAAIQNHKQKLDEITRGIEELKKVKLGLEVKKEKISNLERLHSNNLLQLNVLNQEILQAENEEKQLRPISEVKSERITYEDTINIFEEKYNQIIKEVSVFKANKEDANELKTKIISLTKCPTCLQDVIEKHKEHIIQEEVNKINELKIKIEKALINEEEIRAVLKSAKQKLDVIKTEEAKINFYLQIKQGLESKRLLIEKIKTEQLKLEDEISLLKDEISKISEDVKHLDIVTQEYENTKKELDKLIEMEKQREIAYSTKQKEIEFISRSIDELILDVEKKEKVKLKLIKYTEIQDLIENKFMNIITQIEQAVFVSSHVLFNSLFKKWFNILIDDEGFEVDIDQDFGPLISYKGHNADYKNLSGGEKTAAALAYRLALNQVINKIMSSVRTKEIIILDEPTDGFSSEQLDKMRDIFSMLDLKQVIIVSHETKVESVADNIIRIKKDKGISKINS